MGKLERTCAIGEDGYQSALHNVLAIGEVTLVEAEILTCCIIRLAPAPIVSRGQLMLKVERHDGERCCVWRTSEDCGWKMPMRSVIARYGKHLTAA